MFDLLSKWFSVKVYNVLIAKHTRDAVDGMKFEKIVLVRQRRVYDTDESTYPNLKTLLKFDPREFLNVLSLVPRDYSIIRRCI